VAKGKVAADRDLEIAGFNADGRRPGVKPGLFFSYVDAMMDERRGEVVDDWAQIQSSTQDERWVRTRTGLA